MTPRRIIAIVTTVSVAIAIMSLAFRAPEPTTTAPPEPTVTTPPLNTPSPSTPDPPHTPIPTRTSSTSASPEPSVYDPRTNDLPTTDELTGFVTAFAEAFARPAAGEEQQWRTNIASFLTWDMQLTVSKIGPQMVPYAQVTGPIKIHGTAWPFQADVPTNADMMVLTICPDTSHEPHTTRTMLVCGINLNGRP